MKHFQEFGFDLIFWPRRLPLNNGQAMPHENRLSTCRTWHLGLVFKHKLAF